MHAEHRGAAVTRSNPRAKRVTVIIEADDHIEAWQAENPEEISLNIDETSPLHGYPYAPTQQGRSRLGVDVECGELSRLVSATGDKVAELLGRIGTDAPAVPGEER